MDKFFKELRRRNVVRVAGVYAVVGWVLVQIATTLEESMGLPGWFDGIIVAFLIIGLPIALIFAWAFELTPDGVVRTANIPEGESITAETGRKLDYVIILGIMILGVVIVMQGSDEPAIDAESDESLAETVAAETAKGPGDSSGDAPLEKSIAVLPFTNRSPNPDDAFFADGVHDDLLTQLSKIADMHVISRTSVMSYAGADRKIPDIARELGVATIMEGAVQRAGNRVRINVQLIDAETDTHIWAEIYDRELTADNIFDIQSEITLAIASALNAVLSDADELELQKRPTQNLAAYDAFVLGKLQSNRYYSGDEILMQGVASFDTAIALDPEFGEAYAGRAFAQIAIYWYTAAEGDWLAATEESLGRAEALAPDAVETLTARGYFHYWGHLDYASADVAFDRALEKSPNFLDAIAGKSFVARRDRRFEEAITLMEMGRRLDPLNVDMHSSIVETLGGLGRFDAALAALRRAEATGQALSIDAAVVSEFWDRQGNAQLAFETAMQVKGPAALSLYQYRISHAMRTRNPANIRFALDSWPEELRRPGHAPEAYELMRTKALRVVGETDAAREVLLEIKARIEAADEPYSEGWQANALYHPMELPGLLGDLDGVREAIADFESQYQPDSWGEATFLTRFAQALIRAGDVDAGLDYVDELVDRRAPWVYLPLSIDPAFDTVREHPRYLTLQADYEDWAASSAAAP